MKMHSYCKAFICRCALPENGMFAMLVRALCIRPTPFLYRHQWAFRCTSTRLLNFKMSARYTIHMLGECTVIVSNRLDMDFVGKCDAWQTPVNNYICKCLHENNTLARHIHGASRIHKLRMRAFAFLHEANYINIIVISKLKSRC
jgi:hypothetical protein